MSGKCEYIRETGLQWCIALADAVQQRREADLGAGFDITVVGGKKVALYRITNGSASIAVPFCPFCGGRLMEDSNEPT